jgi:nicotinate phosphoribosyltransferase
MLQDTLSLDGSGESDGTPLIRPYVRAGAPVLKTSTLDEIRGRCADQLATLPTPLRRLEEDYEYPVTVSRELRALASRLDRVRT